MKANKFLALFFFLLGSIHYGKTQNSICHFDRPFYFPGQFVHYAFYTDIAPDSFIVEVQLFRGSEEIDQHFQLIRNGHTHGFFALSFDLIGGDYFVRISVFPEKTLEAIPLMITPVTVLSDQDTGEDKALIAVSDNGDSHQNIRIDMADSFQRRREMSCTVKVPGGQAGQEISIAVRDKLLHPAGETIRFQANPKIEQELTSFIPLVGKRKILDKKQNTRAFLFSCNPDQVSFRFNWVDPDGDFMINMIPFYGEKDIYFVDNGGNRIDVNLMRETTFNVPEVEHVTINSVNEIVRANADRKKIYQLFSKVEENLVQDSFSRFHPVLRPDMDIDVQDYAIRGKLVDLLKEVITPFKFRKDNNDEYRIKVLYEVLDLKYFYDSDPIFIINGKVTRDFTFIANLPLQDIKRLKIYAHLETIRDLKLVDIGGVGVIEMVDPLFSISDDQCLPHKVVQGIQVPIAYPLRADSRGELPQLKSLLYWMPNATLDSNGEYTFMLPASDDISRFEIEVVHPGTLSVGRKEIEIRL